MNIDTVQALLGWTALINIGFMTFWFLGIMFAHDFIYRLHGRWFTMSPEQFDTAHYVAMAIAKLMNLMFFIAPYLVLRFLL